MIQARNQWLNYLIDARLQGVNRLFVSLFEVMQKRYYTADIFF